MNKQRLKSFNRQIARIYATNIFLSAVATALNYYLFNNNNILYFALALNGVALALFQPWKIMGCLNEGYGYKQGLEIIAQEKGVENA